MPPLRKVRDAAHARQLLAELEKSRLSLAEFARQRGIDGRSLNMHRRNVEASTGRQPRLVELVADATPEAPRGARYFVWCGDIRVEVDEHFDEDVLRRLLTAVLSC